MHARKSNKPKQSKMNPETIKQNLVEQICELLKLLPSYRMLHNATQLESILAIFPITADQIRAGMWSN